jgi:hypothetical protein
LTPTSTALPPSATPIPPSATPTVGAPSGPALRVDVSPATVNPGDAVQATLRLFNVTNLYGLEVLCQVNPTILSGAGRQDGEGFSTGNSFLVDNGYKADGSWLVAASRLLPNPAVSGNVVAFGLNYTALNTGSSVVNCTALGVDINGRDVALQVINSTGVAPATLPTPAFTPTPTVIPPTPTPGALSVISGTAVYPNRSDHSGIRVQLLAGTQVLAELVTNATGAYRFTDVPVGSYTVQVSAPQSLPVVYNAPVASDGTHVDLGSNTLRVGDLDNNQTIDVVDVAFVSANFGVLVPPAPAISDLNRDQKVDVRDLVLIGGNFGLKGAQAGN